MSTLQPTTLVSKEFTPEVIEKIKRGGSRREESSALSKADQISKRVDKIEPEASKQRVETLKSLFFSGLSAIPALLILTFLVIMIFVL